MKLIVAGRASEVRGFALAGVETIACETTERATAIVDGLGTDVGLLIVSDWFAQAAAPRLSLLRARKGPPVVLTLPPDSDEDAERR